MKQLHCGNSNAGYGQSFSLGETMFEYAVHRHVSGMLHSCYRQFTAQDRTWPGQTWAMGVWLYTAHGINKSYILHKQATLATQPNGRNKSYTLHNQATLAAIKTLYLIHSYTCIFKRGFIAYNLHTRYISKATLYLFLLALSLLFLLFC